MLEVGVDLEGGILAGGDGLDDRLRAGQHVTGIKQTIDLLARQRRAHPDGDDDRAEAGAGAFRPGDIPHHSPG